MLDHLDDLESDFSAVHGIDDIYDLPGPQFFAWAWRIPSYQGVMRTLIEAEQLREAEGQTPSGPSGRASDGPVREVPASRGVLRHEFSDLIEVAEVQGD